MNYIKQLNAFYDQLEINPLNSSEIALWHALMRINNKTAWSNKFTVASSTLCRNAGLKDSKKSSTFYNARNGLEQKGLIRWESRKGNQSAEYSIKDLSTLFVDKVIESNVDSSVVSDVDSSVALNKQDLNINKTNYPEEDEEVFSNIRAREEIFENWNKNLKPLNFSQQAMVDSYITHFGIGLIKQAVSRTISANPDSPMSYLEKVVQDLAKREQTS